MTSRIFGHGYPDEEFNEFLPKLHSPLPQIDIVPASLAESAPSVVLNLNACGCEVPLSYAQVVELADLLATFCN